MNFPEEDNCSEIDKNIVMEDINKFKTINNNNYIYSSIDSNNLQNFEIYSKIKDYSNNNEMNVHFNFHQENECFGLEKFCKSEEHYEHSLSHNIIQINEFDDEIKYDNAEHKKEQLIITNLNEEYNDSDIDYRQYNNQQDFKLNSKIHMQGNGIEMIHNQNITDENNRYMIEDEGKSNNLTDFQKNLFKENFTNLKVDSKLSNQHNNLNNSNLKEQNFNIEDNRYFGEQSIKINNYVYSNIEEKENLKLNKKSNFNEEKILEFNNEDSKNQLLNSDRRKKNDNQKFHYSSKYHNYKSDEKRDENSINLFQQQDKFKNLDNLNKEDFQKIYNKKFKKEKEINNLIYKNNMIDNDNKNINQNFCEMYKNNSENKNVINDFRESEGDENSLLRSLEEKWENIERSKKFFRYNNKNDEYLNNHDKINHVYKVLNVYNNDNRINKNLNTNKTQSKSNNLKPKNTNNFETLEHSQDFQNEISLRERNYKKQDQNHFLLDKSEISENANNYILNKKNEKIFNNSKENWFTIDKNLNCVKDQLYYEENDIILNDENNVFNHLNILSKNPSSKLNDKFIDKCDKNKKQTFQSFNNLKNSSALDFYNNLSLSKNFIYDSGKKLVEENYLEGSEDEDDLDFFIKEKTNLLNKIKEKNSRKINKETNIENIEEEITKENEGLYTYSNKEKDMIMSENNEKIFNNLKLDTRNLIEKIYNENSINSKTIEESLNEINNNLNKYDFLKKETVFSINSSLDRKQKNKNISNQDKCSGVFIYEPNLSKNKFTKKKSFSDKNECNFKPSFLNPFDNKDEKLEKEEKKFYYLNNLNNHIYRLNKNFSHIIDVNNILNESNDKNIKNYENNKDNIIVINTNNSHSTTNNNNNQNFFNTFGVGAQTENKIIDELNPNVQYNVKVPLSTNKGLQIKKNQNFEAKYDSCKEAIKYINYNEKNLDTETDVNKKNLKTFEIYNLKNSQINNNVHKNEIQITNHIDEEVNCELINNFTSNYNMKEKIKNLYDDFVKMNPEIENKNLDKNEYLPSKHSIKFCETSAQKPKYINKNINNINNNNFYYVSNSNQNFPISNFNNLIYSNNKSFPNVSMKYNNSPHNNIFTSNNIENNLEIIKKNLNNCKEKSNLFNKNMKEFSIKKNSNNSLNISYYSTSNKNYIRSFNSYYGDYLNNVNINNSKYQNDKNINFKKNFENTFVRNSNLNSPQNCQNLKIMNKINQNNGLIETFFDIKKIDKEYSDKFGLSNSCLKNLNSNLNISRSNINKKKLYNTKNKIFQPNLIDNMSKSKSKCSNIIKESLYNKNNGKINEYKYGLMSNLNYLTTINHGSPSVKIKNKNYFKNIYN